MNRKEIQKEWTGDIKLYAQYVEIFNIEYDLDGGECEDLVTSEYEKKVDIESLKRYIETLDERDKKIMVMRYGLNKGEEYTQKEVADLLGISQSYISRLEKRIMQRLKKEFIRMTSCA